MKYNTLTNEGAFLKLEGDDGNKLYIPTATAIVIDDDSGMISVKMTGSRKVIATVIKEAHPY